MRGRQGALAAFVVIEALIAAGSDFLINEAASKVNLPLRTTMLLFVPLALAGLGVALWMRVLRVEDKPEVPPVISEGQQQLADAQAVDIAVGVVTLQNTEEIKKLITQAAERATIAAPAVPAGVVSPSGLPRPGTLVGREQELADLEQRLRAGGSVGVFAVEGLPGVGKTALAATAVAQLAGTPDFPGGATWISCEGLRGPAGLEALWSEIARALGAAEVAALPDPEARRAALRAALSDPKRPRLLLALDNVEPGLDPNALLDTLAGGRATLLLTSRNAVVPARLEKVELHPLADPKAIELFTARLRQVDASRPTVDEQGDVATLAALLGGLPLAIELAAAYAGVQKRSLAAVVEEVKEAPMTGGPLRGLQARFERSWQLLTVTQQWLFAGLAVVDGATFPRAAALAIAQGGGPNATVDERANGDLDTLVSLSLVEPQAEERLRLHPLLREYAVERLKALPATVADQLGTAALEFWIGYARKHPDYDGMDALEAESSGLMGALHWAHERDHYRDVLALSHALSRAWETRGRRAEEIRMYTWAVQAAERLGDIGERRWALHYLSAAYGQIGDLARARAGFYEAQRLAQELDDKEAIRQETHELATLDAGAGKMTQARAREGFEEALRLAQELGDKSAIWMEMHALAVLDARAGKAARARAGLKEALQLARDIGDKRAIRMGIHALAALDADDGKMTQARVGYAEALRLAEELGDRAAQSRELQALGRRDLENEDLASAHVELTKAVALARQVQHPALIAEAVRWLAELERKEKHYDAACAGFREALALYERLGDPDAGITRRRLRELGCQP